MGRRRRLPLGGPWGAEGDSPWVRPTIVVLGTRRLDALRQSLPAEVEVAQLTADWFTGGPAVVIAWHARWLEWTSLPEERVLVEGDLVIGEWRDAPTPPADPDDAAEWIGALAASLQDAPAPWEPPDRSRVFTLHDYHQAALADGALHLHPQARIVPGASVTAPASLGANAVVTAGATVERAVMLGPNVVKGHLRDVILGPHVNRASGSALTHACVALGEIARLGDIDEPLPDADVAAYCRRLLGTEVSATRMRSGFRNHVYRVESGGERIIAKWTENPDPTPLWVEHHCLVELDDAEVTAVPGWLDLRRRDFPRVVLPCGWLPGRELRTSLLTDALVARMAEMLRRVHERDGHAIREAMPHFPGFGYASPSACATWMHETLRYYLYYRGKAGLGADPLVERLQGAAARASEEAAASAEWWEDAPLGLCHGDPVPHNFMWDEAGARLSLVDWERAGVGDPRYDLAWALALNSLVGAREEAFLDAYGGGAAFRRAVLTYRRIIAVAWPVHLLAYLVRYMRERFPVTRPHEEYVSFNTAETYRRLAEGFSYLGEPTGQNELEAGGTLVF